MLTNLEIDSILKKIKQEVESRSYQLPQKYLQLTFKDPEMTSYVNGQGGFYHQFLALFTRYTQPENILELGNAFGVSTIMIASELLPNAKLTTVDILKDQRYVPEFVYKDNRIRFVYGDDLDLNIYGNNIPQGIDWWFTDTVHFYQQIRDEYNVYEPLLKDGAFILIDDIWVKDKGKLFQELPFEKWDLSSWCHHNGFGLLRYKRDKQDDNPLLTSSLQSAKIGYRKFYALQNDLNRKFYRNFYNKIRVWAKRHTQLAQIIRVFLRPLKRLYTPDDKTY